MAQVAGLLFVAALIATVAGFAVHVYRAAAAEGILPLPKVPKLTSGKRRSPKAQTQRARKQAVRTGRTASVIFAEAITTDWLARKAHQRANPKPSRRSRETTPDPAPGEPAMPVQISHPPRDDDAARERSNHYKSSSGGTPMPTTTSGGGAAGDFMVALNRLVAEARGGGIRQKARVNLVMGEGVTQQGAVLDQYARDLQESGQYPPHVWEPVLQAAGMLRGAAAHLTESGTAIGEIARTPAGELAGKAPARDELNRA